MKQTLTINSKEGILVTLSILRGGMPTDGFWNVDNNTLLLGLERWQEFQSIWGNITAQQEFISKLQKVSSKQLL